MGLSGTTIKNHFPAELRRKASGRAVPVADDPTHPYHKAAAAVRERYASKGTGRRNTRPHPWQRARQAAIP